MRTHLPVFGALIFLAVAAPLYADEAKLDDGFKPMFNGKDLTGWVNVNCAPGTFFVKDGEIITTGKPTGFLRTARQYENFIADFEWMHVNTKEVGNSGFFVWADPLPGVGTPYTRGIEVQVLVNLEKEGYYTSQGDLFSIHGATCKPDRPHPQGWARCLPSERRCKGGGHWNHYKVVANNGIIKLHVNGKEVSGLSECKPRKGYLALESEGAECHFRRLKIKELPSTKPMPDETAQEARAFHNLYTGLDLSGWKADADARKHWQPSDWMLRYDGRGAPLRTAKSYGNIELIADFSFPAKKTGPASCTFVFRESADGSAQLKLSSDGALTYKASHTMGGEELGTTLKGLHRPGQWNRLRATIEEKTLNVAINGKQAIKLGISAAGPTGTLALAADSEMSFGNIFVREMDKK